MKIKELLEEKYSQYGHSEDFNCLMRYMDNDCVVAYKKESLGIIFIIRGLRKYFAFVSITKDKFYLGGYDFKLTRLSVSNALKLTNNNLTIVNKEEMNKLMKLEILNNLE